MIKPTLYLRLDPEVGSAGHHLAEVAGTEPRVDLSQLGNATLQRTIALDIENDEERWEAVFDAYRTKGNERDLTASCRVWHYEGGALQDLESRSTHLACVLKAMLEGIGLAVSGLPWATLEAKPAS